MNRLVLKSKANEILFSYRKYYENTLFVVVLISAVVSLVTGFLSSFFIPVLVTVIGNVVNLVFGHGRYVASLKVSKDQNIDAQEDGFAGAKNFKNLFGTYAIMGLMTFAISFVIAFIGLFAYGMSNLGNLTDLVRELDYYGTGVSVNSLNVLGSLLVFILFVIILISIAILYFRCCTVLVPYLLEEKGIKNFNALKESNRMMKGYKWDYFMLLLSYFGWMILGVVISMVTSLIIGFIPLGLLTTFITTIINGYINIMLYNAHLSLTETQFWFALDEIHNPKPIEVNEVVEVYEEHNIEE